LLWIPACTLYDAYALWVDDSYHDVGILGVDFEWWMPLEPPRADNNE
jgi:hypothetical protein